jgi:hypothetical protein
MGNNVVIDKTPDAQFIISMLAAFILEEVR